MYHKKNTLRKFNIYRRKNKLDRFSRFNVYCSYRAKPLNRSPARLNQPSSNVEKKTSVCMRHLS